MKNVAQWFYDQVFSEEIIRPRKEVPKERLPSLLRTARSLEGSWQNRNMIFLKQARLLADYTDDYPFEGSLTRYYPTYQSFTDQELRGYFSWRTKLRQGDVRKAPLSFAFLYIYELLNQIGVSSPLEGYQKLLDFRDRYSPLDDGIVSYLKRWLRDYIIYYDLDPALLEDTPLLLLGRSIAVLDHIQSAPPAAVMAALEQLPLRWIKRSKFCQQHRTEYEAVLVPVLRRVAEHCDKRTKRGFVGQYCGGRKKDFVWLFESAVFCDPLKRDSFQYVLDEYCRFQCQSGRWLMESFVFSPTQYTKLEELTKAVDSLLRLELDPKHPIKSSLDTKWVLKIIREEIDAWLAARKAAQAKKVTIDRSQLAAIRRDAAITQEKLAIEEELEEAPPPAPVTAPPAPEPAAQAADTPLNPEEYRLLQSLLYGRDTGWVRAQGLLLSVLLDGINEKLYEQFQDTVLDEEGQPIVDYLEDLKEMVSP